MGRKKYIPNILTLLRIILTINYLWLLSMIEESGGYRIYIIYAALIFILICVTDLADGKIARRIKAESKLGSILDVSADFTFIILSLSFWSIKNKIPIWFIFLVLFKFIEFISTSYIVRVSPRWSKGVFMFDYLGRISACNFFLTPGMVLLTYIGISINYIWAFIYLTTVLVIISSVERFLICYITLKQRTIMFICNNILDN